MGNKFDFVNFVTEGAIVDGNNAPFCYPKDIPWFDKTAYERGRKFYWNNYALNWVGIGVTGSIAVAVKPMASTLFRNFNFYPENRWADRGFETMTYVASWMESNLDDPKSEGVKMIRKVRRIHEKTCRLEPDHNLLPIPDSVVPKKYHELAEIVQKATEPLTIRDAELVSHLHTWYPKVPFSQLHMALVQFGMYHHFWNFPQLLKVNEDDLRGYTHWWAVIGRMLGIEDQYNPALHQDKDLYQRMLENFAFPVLKGVDPTAALFLDTGFQRVYLPFKTVLCVLVEHCGGNTEVIKKSMRRREKLALYGWKPLLNLYWWVPPIRYFVDTSLFWGHKALVAYMGYKRGYDYRQGNKGCAYFASAQKIQAYGGWDDKFYTKY